MKKVESTIEKRANRRSFLKNGIAAAGAVTVGAGMMSSGLSALGADREHGGITEGDAAVLRYLAAIELIETDLWQQYNELGGQDAPSSAYKTGPQQLDGDMPRSEEHTSELQSPDHLVCRLLLEKKKIYKY